MPAAAEVCTVFLNCSSGLSSKDDVPQQLAAILREDGTEARIVPCEKGTDISALAEEAVKTGAAMVVAGGGDGTLRAVASALVNTGVIFGVLPVGTLNHFARDLKIPLDLEQAARNLSTGRSISVDVGEVNGHVFINNSIIGLYPTYRFLREYVERKGWRNWLAFTWAVLTVFKRYPFLTLRFHVEGKPIVRTTPYVMIANNEHEMEGYQLGTRSRLDTGELWIYIMRRRGRWGLLRMIVSLVLGQFNKTRDFEIFHASEVWIEGRQKRLGVALDGEITILDTPLHYRSIPKALQVVAPQAETDK
jgi:diacylglycerol kinase family enzyme